MAIELYPVIQMYPPGSLAETIAQAEEAIGAGVTGFFLEDRTYSQQSLVFEAYRRLRTTHPETPVGLNFDGRSGYEALAKTLLALERGAIPDLPFGLWRSTVPFDIDAARELQQTSHRLRSSTLLLAGVSTYFDIYHRHDIAKAERDTQQNVDRLDVVVATGSHMSTEPLPSMIKAIHRKLRGAKPLAIAAPMQPENVANYPHEWLLATPKEPLQKHDLQYLHELVAATGEIDLASYDALEWA